MARAFWYPDRTDLQVLAHRLAIYLFPGYEANSGAILTAMVRDESMLESALGVPSQPYYRTTIDKAAAMLRSLVKNHPFVDGNKRMGMATTFLFLLENGYLFAPTNEEMVQFSLELARSQPAMGWKEIARWIRARSFRLEIDRQAGTMSVAITSRRSSETAVSGIPRAALVNKLRKELAAR